MPVAIKSTGGGSVTLAAVNTANDYTLTLPAQTGTVITSDGSNNVSVAGNLSFNSGYGSAAVAYGCRAWVNFNGTGTVAIRASGNVTSITDNGSGDYTVNFTTAMPDANYSAVTTTEADSSNDSRFIAPLKYNARTTTSVGLYTATSSANVRYDVAYVGVAIFR